jgi:protein-disulfide isomerase
MLRLVLAAILVAGSSFDVREIVVDTAGAPMRGAADAPLTLVDFGDYQCPYCAGYVRNTLPWIERDYVVTGRIKYVFRDFPVEALHKQAFKAHEAAKCAGDHGQYWPMHDLLFANQKALDRSTLVAHASALHLEPLTFQQCLDSGKHAAAIKKNVADGQAAGITATPTFMLGLTEPDRTTIKVLRVIRGAQPYEQFKEAIDTVLRASPAR